MSPENYIKAKVVAFAAQEAAHCGGFNGMLAVACILRNRQKSGWFGGDWLRIVANAHEAGALLDERWPNVGEGLPGTEELTPQVRRVLQEVDDIFLGTFDDQMTKGGLYYMDLLYRERGRTMRHWFEQHILKDQVRHPQVAQVGMIQIFS